MAASRFVVIVAALARAEVVEWSNLSAVEAVNGRLAANWVVMSRSCAATAEAMLQETDRRLAVAVGAAAKDLNLPETSVSCPVVVCLNVGTIVELLGAAAQMRRYDKNEDNERFRSWYSTTCGSVEVGWITYGEPAKLWWLGPEKVFQADLAKGEKNTHWRTVVLGHKFQATVDDKVVGEYEALHDGIFVVEPADRPTSTRTQDEWTAKQKKTIEFERARADRVKRTFTTHGYDKEALPLELYADMETYWHNNKDSLSYEEWDNKGAYVNWWRSPPSMAYMPFGLKTKWHEALKALVERWIGYAVELERTDLYGMRAYSNGSVLLPHVDREETHAVSMIINIAQYGMQEDWNVEIMDLAKQTFVEVSMGAGELVYYESAKCLHGRPKPMRGSMYVNLFAHFRPKNDPKWFLESPRDFKPYDYRNRHGVAEDDDAEPGDWRRMADELSRPPPPKRKNATKLVEARDIRTASLLGKQQRAAPDRETRTAAKGAKYVHAHKLRPRWQRFGERVGRGAIAVGVLCSLVLCCGIARRRRRRRARQPVRSTKSTNGRPPAGSASPTFANSRAQHLPPHVRQAARSNRGLATVEKWLAMSRKAADAREAEPPRRALLHHAAAHGAAAVARACIRAGADPNLVDDAGDAPLHLAALSGSGAIVNVLLEAGAIPDAPDALGKTPLVRARDANNTGCAILISKKLDARRRNNHTNGTSAPASSNGVSLRRVSAHGDDAV